MEYRKFGTTDLRVSVIGFGAWGIGGPAMAGSTPIGWGRVDDDVSEQALRKAYELGVNFFDTADFYGLGHSEELIGRTVARNNDVIIATKVGHRLDRDQNIVLDYSKQHILAACEASLKRLGRETIDYYQLHSAKLSHLEQGECVEAMSTLKEQGKIRCWGVSLNTYKPEPEAEFMMKRQMGNGFQLVLNIINQRAVPLMQRAAGAGYGIIARMPLQFGLLTGKFNQKTTFEKTDHRSFRLPPAILDTSLRALSGVWPLAERYRTSNAGVALGFVAGFREVSTIIPGIKTPEQAIENSRAPAPISEADMGFLRKLYDEKLAGVLEMMEQQG